MCVFQLGLGNYNFFKWVFKHKSGVIHSFTLTRVDASPVHRDSLARAGSPCTDWRGGAWLGRRFRRTWATRRAAGSRGWARSARSGSPPRTSRRGSRPAAPRLGNFRSPACWRSVSRFSPPAAHQRNSYNIHLKTRSKKSETPGPAKISSWSGEKIITGKGVQLQQVLMLAEISGFVSLPCISLLTKVVSWFSSYGYFIDLACQTHKQIVQKKTKLFKNLKSKKNYNIWLNKQSRLVCSQ